MTDPMTPTVEQAAGVVRPIVGDLICTDVLTDDQFTEECDAGTKRILQALSDANLLVPAVSAEDADLLLQKLIGASIAFSMDTGPVSAVSDAKSAILALLSRTGEGKP